MKRIIFCLSLFFLVLVGCAVAPIYDLRQFPSYRLGVVQVAWMDPNWHIDVWVGQPSDNPTFTLLPGWQKEWRIEADNALIYAEAWIWDGGKKLVVARIKKPLRIIKASKVRDWDGYGWRVMLQSGDFVALR